MGTEDVSTSDSCEYSSYLLMRRSDALARTGFADDAHDFPGPHRKTDLVHGVHSSLARDEADAQIAHLNEW